jgi:hypothetical protein
VVAKPDPVWGESPCAFVTLKPDADAVAADDIIAWCRANLANFKVPRSVVFGPLPKTSTARSRSTNCASAPRRPLNNFPLGPNSMQCNFADIPVYRLAQERYYAERESHIERLMYPPNDPWSEQARELHKRDPRLYIPFRDHLERSYGGMWRFNEIVGYIRVHFFGSQIRGEYFSVIKKRMVRTRRKVFEYRTHKLAPEISVPAKASSEEIFKLVKQYVADCRQELPGRQIDETMLDVLGPYIDWHRLYMDQLQHRKVA